MPCGRSLNVRPPPQRVRAQAAVRTTPPEHAIAVQMLFIAGPYSGRLVVLAPKAGAGALWLLSRVRLALALLGDEPALLAAAYTPVRVKPFEDELGGGCAQRRAA